MTTERRDRIVVGVDFSEGARAALAAAHTLCRGVPADLHLVHVQEPGVSSSPGAERSWLGGGADARIAGEVQVRTGDAWVGLAREAIAIGAVAIVVGSHGRAGYQPIELGSTAARVGLIAPCPVVLVGPRAARGSRPDAVRRILGIPFTKDELHA